MLRYFLIGLLLLVVALVSALTTMRLAIKVREVRVPDLRNKIPSEAKRLAELDGLAAQVDSNYYSAIVPEGRVLSQTPTAGTLVRRGWEVRLALSLGPQRVTIPLVVGKSDRAAAISIAERGLQLSFTDRIQISGAEDDQVIAQDPPANAKDVSAPKISLLVAQSPSLLGIGIDEDTCGIVHSDQTLQVIGRGAVTIVDGSHVRTDAYRGKGYRPLMVSGAVLHALPSGYWFDLRSRELLAAARALEEREASE